MNIAADLKRKYFIYKNFTKRCLIADSVTKFVHKNSNQTNPTFISVFLSRVILDILEIIVNGKNIDLSVHVVPNTDNNKEEVPLEFENRIPFNLSTPLVISGNVEFMRLMEITNGNDSVFRLMEDLEKINNKYYKTFKTW